MLCSWHQKRLNRPPKLALGLGSGRFRCTTRSRTPIAHGYRTRLLTTVTFGAKIIEVHPGLYKLDCIYGLLRVPMIHRIAGPLLKVRAGCSDSPVRDQAE